MKFTVHGVRKKIPNTNEISVFICRYSVYFGILNTDVGVGIDFFSNIAISVFWYTG